MAHLAHIVPVIQLLPPQPALQSVNVLNPTLKQRHKKYNNTIMKRKCLIDNEKNDRRWRGVISFNYWTCKETFRLLSIFRTARKREIPRMERNLAAS
jgi:hypothetical protein